MQNNIYDNRELSWLKFNERVLEEAMDSCVPLLERLTFSSIFQSNLDEFFMVRVGSLFDQMLLDPTMRENKTHMTSNEQLNAIYARVRELEPVKDKTYWIIMELLASYGVEHITDLSKLSTKDMDYLELYFNKEIKPLLSPLIMDKRHPVPFLKNKEIYAVIQLESKSGMKLGILPISEAFGRIVRLEGSTFRFVLAEDLIIHYAPAVFSNYNVLNKALIRITRNADICEEDDEELLDRDFDFREYMEELVKKRKKLSPVRLQISGNLSQEIIKYLCKRLELEPKQVFTAAAPLDLSYVFKIKNFLDSDIEELCYNELVPQKSPSVTELEPMFDQIQRKDIFLSYPYESIRPFIRLLNEVACDPDVVSVKITLYRLARNSQVIRALIEAAENGIDVLALVELRARFDEENNISWSKRLQKAGCTIIYGPQNLKVHSKLLLITRKNGDTLEYVTQIGTGNYNEKTSELYTDFSLMTANKEIASEASEVFNALSMGTLLETSNNLLVAPLCLQNRVLEMIDRETEIAKTGKPAYVGIKINSLSDKVIIDKLVEASQAGVKIELLIRGLCCLISGIKGKTENITVTSIVGRYLEHSRIYIFGTGSRRKLYISSADFMTRNTVKRIEVAAPILDAKIRRTVWNIFRKQLDDTVKARVQQPDGKYVRRGGKRKALDTQIYFYEQAYAAAKLMPQRSVKNELPKHSKGYVPSRFFSEFLKQD